MARFSLSFLALCFFLALMASALPAKRGDDDLDAGDAVAAALNALKAFENVKEEKNDNNDIPDKPSAAHGANVKEGTTTPQPIPSGTRTTVQTPAAASSSAAAAPKKKKQSSTNMLSHIPIIGGVLGGGEGLGSLLPTR
ncbi:hypothetical protein IFM58399_01006 [Aspergillus lentulus]|uniref:Uncharacterized protein n=1 Tax=Aspergillus lentulus TaxID=293939 RepID=A0AAN5YT83_ASPLE|nr:uncharacterized protein IFM58399_01006 [Aspergillus lentulus]KAF4159381.1 hypothetical protein CNMCM6069_002048 [Aspergillus lentulus]KAF4168642.1 hypothetical protein CNMCM6936_001517 [Aspergillus lentulus]KAF4173500.1 hypothetical protein CNMCM8060_000078 [Aspergillus lentulus]KAF4188217.1 hypothetical protein CNMCM7927_002314 [Aspergillus lentulus]KAF4195445.1 hypothetical protein CNMCM8694_006371 [Aspergillus lentulus]